MILVIDTHDPGQVRVELKKDSQVVLSSTAEHKIGSQALLPLIYQLLKQAQIDFKDLEAIEVATGPGSFTGLKVGVAVANALGFALGITVNGKEFETVIKYHNKEE